MKLYHFPPAPNPARVLNFIREKGVDIPLQMVNFLDREQHSDWFVSINPRGTVPVLELDDGRYLTESLAIMEYLEEKYPEPPLIGTDAEARAFVRSTERNIEMTVFLPIVRLVHATRSPLGLKPDPHVAARETDTLQKSMPRLNQLIGSSTFVMGDHPTIADCTLLAALSFARLGRLAPEDDYPNVKRWYQDYALRHL